MGLWKIAGVQMDCQFKDKASNLRQIRHHLQDAAQKGAKLIVFPECILTGYCFISKGDALPFAEPIPGPSTQILLEDCNRYNVFAALGMLESADDGALYNSCALLGPTGFVGCYRKIHLPFLGVDRFTTPGDRPFAVHDLGGLKVGMSICYDGSFPESARCLMLQGADLILLPTNWPEGALKSARLLVPARALENTVYYAAVNRIGEEGGFRFIGMSRIVDPQGDFLAQSEDDKPALLLADIDPEKSRKKRIVFKPGEYELDRIKHRRPEMYGVMIK